MGLRFRKSIKIAPGLRLNFGLRGLSATLGPRGASVNLSPRGVYQNLGLPGTGLSLRRRLDSPTPRRSAPAGNRKMGVAFKLQDDGVVRVVDDSGNELPPRLTKLAREQMESTWRPWLEEKCDHWNTGIDELLNIHLETPDPKAPPRASHRVQFKGDQPAEPAPQPIPFLARIFRSWRERIERSNAEAFERYRTALVAWERDRDEHDREEDARLTLFGPNAAVTPEALQNYLCDVLGRVKWPRETTVSLEVTDVLDAVSVDVDLPEIEDMPDKTATVASRGLKLNIKDRPVTQRRKEYMAHIHGLLFRVIGETFAAFPRLTQVTASGFSQRPERESHAVVDEYLLSVRVARSDWETLNFSALEDVDPVAILAHFELKRDMTLTGIFRPIDPFPPFAGH